jgi:hypothetical protein
MIAQTTSHSLANKIKIQEKKAFENMIAQTISHSEFVGLDDDHGK